MQKLRRRDVRYSVQYRPDYTEKTLENKGR